MKLFSLLVLFLSITTFAQAQKVVPNEKTLAAGRQNPDSNFVKYLYKLALSMDDDRNKADSEEALLQEAVTTAERINYTTGIISPRENLSQFYFLKGRLGTSLNLLQKNEALSIEQGDSVALYNTLRLIAAIYLRAGDMSMLRECLSRRQQILDNNGIKNLKDTSYAVLSQYNSLGQYYAQRQINKADSIKYFYGKIIQLGKNTQMENLWEQLGNGGMGTYFSSINQFDSAIYHYKIAQAAAFAGNRTDNYYGFLNRLSSSYQKLGVPDSAFAYAYKVYDTATKFGYLGLLASSAGTLAQVFKDQHKYDSAVKYLEISQQYMDSSVGQEAIKSIQSLTSDQQLKEKETKREKEQAIKEYQSRIKTYLFIAGLLLMLLIIGFMYRVNKQRSKSKKIIESAYDDLKSTQAQLIQSEKMASLGELTAGIAHEIQNPLNFVNNFSEVSNELIDEMNEELNKGDIAEAKAISSDIKQNLEKINHHGKRADAIVKGMLQHSQSSKGQKEPTDINALCDEYLRLSYHGLRAKDKSFNATLKTDFDQSIGKINIIPQDMGRVILNLITNAFYAVDEKKKAGMDNYDPTISISTKKINDQVEISIADNGKGIPSSIKDKIFQPFFTTKPTGQGTGLGLSLAYDIVKAHGGEIKAKSKPGEGSEFIIELPVKNI